MAKIVFEIGTEEIPAKFMGQALNELKELGESKLREYRIGYEEVKTYGTPRRLAILIEGAAPMQEDLVQENKGPAKRIAFDEKGVPTKAALGFAKSQGIAVDELIIKEIDGAEYLFARRLEKGKPSEEVLPEILPQLVTGLHFPKPMRWADKEIKFARPIQWFLALYDDKVISFSIEGISAGRTTQGHRFLSQGPIDVEHADDYLAKMREAFVIVDQRERQELIRRQVMETAESYGGHAIIDDDLLEEVNYLVEYPTPLAGKFLEDYLRLPKEVLITTMKEHQKYFPVYKDNGELLPLFITIRNGNADHLDIVRQGNEKVLQARLADANFFYEEDQKEPLAKKRDKLKTIVFQESLGTVYQKTERIETLAKDFCDLVKMGEEEKALAKRAAQICKADLVTNMVFEFTELQGIMGREYARLSGESPVVSEAIFEHYLPRFAGDILPKTDVGRIIAISDKIDTIAGCFGIGIIPTGSQDPYALRRQALGICNIILDAGWDLTVDQVVGTALDLLSEEKLLKGERQKIEGSILEFFKQRIRNIMLDKGYTFDVVDAVITTGYSNIPDVAKRCQAIQEVRGREEFAPVMAAFTRVINLAKKVQEDSLDVEEELLVEKAEQDLYSALLAAEGPIFSAATQGDYRLILTKLQEIVTPINNFFNEVMVMAEDEKLRNNRLALLKRIENLLMVVGDLSQLS